MKKTTIRKITAALLCALLLLSAPMGTNLPGGFALTASAASYSGTCGENLTWALNTTTGILSITGTGEMKDRNWVDDGAPWFSYCSFIQKVQIANGVTSIGYGAFRSCTSLMSITIPDRVTSIGSSAFSGCTSLTSIIIPNSVTSIGWNAFRHCTSLTSITVDLENPFYSSDSHGVLFDKNKTALIRCPAGSTLTEYTIPDSVTNIVDSAFEDCTSLTSVTIPDSVTRIGHDVFDFCTSLTSITVDSANQSYSSDSHGVLFDKNKTVLICCPAGSTQYTIPDSVTGIRYEAFSYCTSLTSVIIGNSVTSIGASAFRGCTSLTSVTIPDSVTSIESFAFSDCSSLNYVHIPASVTTIRGSILYNSPAYICSDTAECYAKEYAEANGIEFRVCSEQSTSISGTCGENLTWTLNTTTGILTISGTGEMENYSSGNDAPWYKHYVSIREVRIADGVTGIGFFAFWNCTSLTGITIPNSVMSIGEGAFYFCTSLTSITIPDSVVSIGDRAFFNCSSLTSIAIPDSVTNIGIDAFHSCTALTGVIIPDSVTSIGNGAFMHCSSLTSIKVDAANQFYSSDSHDVLFDKNKNTLILFPCGSTLNEYLIPNSVTRIEDNAFYECSSLSGITIPNSVTTIGKDAFAFSTALKSIYIPDSVTEIGQGAFAGCTALRNATLPNNMPSIVDSLFASCSSLESITIPNSVTSIGHYAFFGCQALTDITIPSNVTSIGCDAFSECNGLTSIVIPESVTSISTRAFYKCTALTSISLPDEVIRFGEVVFFETGLYNDESNWTDGVLYIGHHLIEAKSSITGSYTIKTGTKNIAEWAFYDCSSLTTIIIPNSVTSIGYELFTNCSSLIYVHIPDSVTEIRGSILYNSPAYICSDTAECYAKEYAEANGIEFRVCDGHGAAEPEPPKFDGTTGTVQADCTPGCFDEDAHLVVSESDKTLPEFGITVSDYAQVQKIYNIQVQNAHGQPLQPKSGHTVTLRLPLPLDDHGNPYDAGKYSVYHLIDNDPANTESFRAKKGNLKIENGFLVIEVSHFSPFVVVVESEMPTVSIAGNPGTFTLRYNETLVLHAEAENLPDGASLLWEADKDGIVELKPSGDGTTCEVISKKTGDVRITVKVVDADGSEIEGSGSDTETVQSKAGFFQKLLAFFRLLFGIKVRIDQRKK